MKLSSADRKDSQENFLKFLSTHPQSSSKFSNENKSVFLKLHPKIFFYSKY